MLTKNTDKDLFSTKIPIQETTRIIPEIPMESFDALPLFLPDDWSFGWRCVGKFAAFCCTILFSLLSSLYMR